MRHARRSVQPQQPSIGWLIESELLVDRGTGEGAKTFDIDFLYLNLDACLDSSCVTSESRDPLF
jgi:hypothetical protein